MTVELNSFTNTLSQLTAQQSFCVAYSGGLDSTVLLHLLWRYQRQNPSLRVRAVHVHHGLSRFADTWVQHCEQTCAQWQLPLTVYRLAVSKAPGASLEAEARAARYHQLQQTLQPHECLVMAHHADDQAETLLLQLLRGAGLPGLAAMPAVRRVGSHAWIRPLLGFTREQLLRYATEQDLCWIEDDSNTNLQFARNYLRHQVMPLLKARWPAAATTLSRSANHVAQAHQMLNEVVTQDYAEVSTDNGALPLVPLLRLSIPRQYAVVRRWLRSQGMRHPSTQQLTQIFTDIVQARGDAQPCVDVEGWQIRRFQQALYLQRPMPDMRDVSYTWDVRETLPLSAGLGVLRATVAMGRGIVWNPEQPIYTVRFRQGGEKLKPVGSRCTYSLKKLMHAQQIPVWQRGSIPLIYQGDTLVMVVGYWISAAHAAAPNQMGCDITTMCQN